MNYLIKKEIEIINKIILEAIKHGADSGGSYNQNEKLLIESIKEWMKTKGIQDFYKINEKNIDGWTVYQIVCK